MRIAAICFLLALTSVFFSKDRPVSKLVKLTADICRDSTAPLVVTADLGESRTLVSCVCSSAGVMMAGYSFLRDSISFNENDTLLSREDARRMILAMGHVHEPSALAIVNVKRKKGSFYVFCKYQNQAGYIILSNIETYL